MGFDTKEPNLRTILDEISSGTTQLPEFQRDWIWDDSHVRSLLASLTRSYPIGAIMVLETGNVPFKPRLFEGVKIPSQITPKYLVLDGQQRLTSMFLSLYSKKPVKTKNEKNKEIKRYYFIDMKKSLDPKVEREDAIISIPESYKLAEDFGQSIILDLSTPQMQYKEKMFPFNLMFDTEGYTKWQTEYMGYHSGNATEIQFFLDFQNKIWLPFQTYKLSVINLFNDTPLDAVCQVFEKVNTGGVTLTVFELITATFAAKEFNLRRDWEERRERVVRNHDVLKGIDGTSFLTAVTLMATYERSLSGGAAVTCKRADVLQLTLSDYQKYANEIEFGFIKAAEILAEEKIFDDRNTPYTTQLIPLSVICAKNKTIIDRQPVKQKVLRWYWCGVFGELYGGANETRFAIDVPDVVSWINEKSDIPRTIRDMNFSPLRLLSLQTRNSAAYKGVSALLMKQGSKDFISATPIDINIFFNNNIDIHHIFPQKWCKPILPPEKYNSIINKTPISYTSNRSIGGDAPSQYLSRIENKYHISRDALDDILSTHLIPINELRSDNFDSFLRIRAGKLLSLIEQATGKPISGKDSPEVVTAFGAPIP